MKNHKPLEAVLHLEMNHGNHVVEVSFKRPRLVKFEPGHPFCVLVDESLPSTVKKLREKALSPDKGPYADNEKQDVRKMAWLMRKSGKGDLEDEAKWLIDVMIPRIQHFVNQEGEEKTEHIDDSDLQSHPDFEFLWNGVPIAARESDEAMVPGRFLSQELIRMRGSNYLLALYTEELAALATSVMRASGREAYMTQIVGPLPNGDISVLYEGVAVFPNERTMVHFALDRTHPAVTGLNVMGDRSVMSILHLRAAANKLKREFVLLNYQLANGLIDDTVIDGRMKLVQEIVGKAKVFMPENIEIPLFLEAVADKRNELRSHMFLQLSVSYAQGVLKYLSDMEDELMEKRGIAKKKAVGSTSGINPEEIERKIRFAADSLVAGFKQYGPQPPLMDATSSLSFFVESTLVKFGLSEESLKNLRAYIFEKGKIFDQPWVAEVDVGEQYVAEALCAQGVLSKMVKLHKEIVDSKGKMPVEDVRTRTKEMIDSVVEGLKQFGRDSEPLEGVRKGMGDFVTVKLPENGYPPELVKELKIYFVQKSREVPK